MGNHGRLLGRGMEERGIRQALGVGLVIVMGVAAAGGQSGDIISPCSVPLTELLRTIQFFNLRGYHCADRRDETEDGYVPGPGANVSCWPFRFDYAPQDWAISLTELLRAIQFFNLGGYHCAASREASEDGFLPGQDPAGCRCGYPGEGEVEGHAEGEGSLEGEGAQEGEGWVHTRG